MVDFKRKLYLKRIGELKMKLQSKILKVGTAFPGLQVEKDRSTAWGKCVGNDKISAEDQGNYIKSLKEKNPDAVVEIEYTQKEGKKGLSVTSVAEVVNGKVVEPKAEEVKKSVGKEDGKKTLSAGTQTKYKSTPVSSRKTSNNTQDSIEKQVALKCASEAIKTMAGVIDTAPEFIKVYECLFDVGLKKIQE